MLHFGHMDCGIVVLCPGMRLTAPEVEEQLLKHWTTNLEGSPLNCFLIIGRYFSGISFGCQPGQRQALKGARDWDFLRVLLVY